MGGCLAAGAALWLSDAAQGRHQKGPTEKSDFSRQTEQALVKTKLERRLQDRDLRARVAIDMPLGLASALLGHADPKLTQRVYRRRPDLVTSAA